MLNAAMNWAALDVLGKMVATDIWEGEAWRHAKRGEAGLLRR